MFRFTIRDILWLTVVAAVGVAWWMDRRNAAVEMAKLRTDQAQLKSQVADLKRGPDWAGMDRVMDRYEARWDFISEARARPRDCAHGSSRFWQSKLCRTGRIALAPKP